MMIPDGQENTFCVNDVFSGACCEACYVFRMGLSSKKDRLNLTRQDLIDCRLDLESVLSMQKGAEIKGKA